MMIKPLPIEALLSYGLLGAGALIIFGILTLLKDNVEKKQRELAREIRKKKKKKKSKKKK
ncbi:MAG: hypothetical protein VW911_03840 [Pelagibacteraceae bacterium]|jgi:hypothetical protein